MERRRHLGEEVGEPDLVGTALPLEVEIHPVQILGLHRGDQRGRQSGRRGGVRGDLVQGLLVETGHGEHDPVPGGVGPGDQVDQVLALVAVPTRPALVERAVGIGVDAEIRQGRQVVDVERGRLGKCPVGGVPEDLMGLDRGRAGQGGRRGGRRRGRRRERGHLVRSAGVEPVAAGGARIGIALVGRGGARRDDGGGHTHHQEHHGGERTGDCGQTTGYRATTRGGGDGVGHHRVPGNHEALRNRGSVGLGRQDVGQFRHGKRCRQGSAVPGRCRTRRGGHGRSSCRTRRDAWCPHLRRSPWSDGHS
jgi:hypothetical protein